MQNKYEQSSYKPEKKIHITSRGLRVRSKSELLIAEAFYSHDVAFHYEEVLLLGGRHAQPQDYRKRDRKQDHGIDNNSEKQHEKEKLIKG